jgi:hypothetical protein
MNVKELIAKLSTLDGNLPVVIDDVSLGFCLGIVVCYLILGAFGMLK